MDIDRIGGRTMLSLTCSLIPSVDLACNGIPRAEDLISGDCATTLFKVLRICKQND